MARFGRRAIARVRGDRNFLKFLFCGLFEADSARYSRTLAFLEEEDPVPPTQFSALDFNALCGT